MLAFPAPASDAMRRPLVITPAVRAEILNELTAAIIAQHKDTASRGCFAIWTQEPSILERQLGLNKIKQSAATDGTGRRDNVSNQWLEHLPFVRNRELPFSICISLCPSYRPNLFKAKLLKKLLSKPMRLPRIAAVFIRSFTFVRFREVFSFIRNTPS